MSHLRFGLWDGMGWDGIDRDGAIVRSMAIDRQGQGRFWPPVPAYMYPIYSRKTREAKGRLFSQPRRTLTQHAYKPPQETCVVDVCSMKYVRAYRCMLVLYIR